MWHTWWMGCGWGMMQRRFFSGPGARLFCGIPVLFTAFIQCLLLCRTGLNKGARVRARVCTCTCMRVYRTRVRPRACMGIAACTTVQISVMISLAVNIRKKLQIGDRLANLFSPASDQSNRDFNQLSLVCLQVESKALLASISHWLLFFPTAYSKSKFLPAKPPGF